MLLLIKTLMREEWRMHVSYSGSNFTMFPVMIGAAALFIGIMSEAFFKAADIQSLMLLLHISALMYGLIIGGFAFMSPEIAERRFGEVRMLMNTPDFLPLEYRRMYFSAYIKDIIFYASILLLPACIGLLGAAMTGFGILTVKDTLVLTGTMFITFNLGFAVSFAIAMANIRSTSLAAAIAGLIFTVVGFGLFLEVPLTYFIPSVGLQDHYFDPVADIEFLAFILLSFVYILMFATMAIAISRERWEAKESTHESNLPETAERFSFFRDSILVAKEFTDLARSGGVSKIAFTLVLPMGALYVLDLIGEAISVEITFDPVFYAIMLGFFGMLIYYWIASSDSLTFLQTTPVRPSDVIYAKLKLHSLLTVLVSLPMAAGIAVFFMDPFAFVVAFPMIFITSLHMGLVLAYLTGFRTAEYMLEARVLMLFVILGALPMNIAAAFITVLEVEKYSTMAPLGLIAIAGYLVAIDPFFFKRIRAKWEDTNFTS